MAALLLLSATRVALLRPRLRLLLAAVLLALTADWAAIALPAVLAPPLDAAAAAGRWLGAALVAGLLARPLVRACFDEGISSLYRESL